jgi:hypothetical protein
MITAAKMTIPLTYGVYATTPRSICRDYEPDEVDKTHKDDRYRNGTDRSVTQQFEPGRQRRYRKSAGQ